MDAPYPVHCSNELTITPWQNIFLLYPYILCVLSMYTWSLGPWTSMFKSKVDRQLGELFFALSLFLLFRFLVVSIRSGLSLMGSEAQTLHILFFPLMAPGHMIPMLDMAKLFAAHGVNPTVLTTPGNVPLVQPSIDRHNESGHENPIQLSLIPFPSGTGLPEGCENLSSVPEDLHAQFFAAMEGLRGPFDEAVGRIVPDCVVSDIFLPWTANVAAEHGIPRLLFHGSNFFAQCAAHSIERHKVLESLPAEESSFVVPDFPHVEMSRSMLPDLVKFGPVLVEVFRKIKESEAENYGTVTNSFYELESDYVDYYRNVMGRKAWCVGPLSLRNKDVVDKSRRGKAASIDHDSCSKWLDGREPRSVVYACFGSLTDLAMEQLKQIASGLESSNHPFIWVVKNDSEEWMARGYEERVEGKGLIIRGWAPQILILSHPSVGGYVTHCGWNSILEGVSAGLPFVTWPFFAEQFYNERLIVDVLKIGVAIGEKEYATKASERKIVEAARIEAAINELMDYGEKANERRRRAKELGEQARRAVEKDGSSYNDMNNLIAELTEMRSAK